MNRRQSFGALGGLLLCPLCAVRSPAADIHWSYEGTAGPDKWGDLDAADRVCSLGSQQSPLDIGATIPAQLAPLKITWAKSADTIVNNGHTIQLGVSPGSTLTTGKDQFTLVQFHFHRPSEHLIGGKGFPMEAHFVHRNDAGTLAVVGVLMASGKPNAVFKKIVSTMPASEGAPIKADSAIDPNALLPANRSYYFYEGSLTIPPCSEVVNWLLLMEPIQVADTDVANFAKLYPLNARPVQKPNRRFVLRSG
jgi:carbonic anhydrase